MRNEDDRQEPHEKEPLEMTSDELLDYALAPEVSEEVKRLAKPPESTDSEQDCE